MNFANIIALPLLLGIGVAFKIYYVDAWRNGQTDLLQSPLTRAIFYSALTTATAFGSLWLSSHPGTSSMGKLLALSLVTTLAAAVLFQPALMGRPRDHSAIRSSRPDQQVDCCRSGFASRRPPRWLRKQADFGAWSQPRPSGRRLWCAAGSGMATRLGRRRRALAWERRLPSRREQGSLPLRGSMSGRRRGSWRRSLRRAVSWGT
jgi:hypothetical protein